MEKVKHCEYFPDALCLSGKELFNQSDEQLLVQTYNLET